MDDNCQKRFRLLEAWEQTFPGIIPGEKSLNHPLIDQIGQPSKGEMLALFLGAALNLPRAEMEELKQDAATTLRKCLSEINDPADPQAQNLRNVLEQKDNWIRKMRLYVKQAGVLKETSEPLDALTAHTRTQASAPTQKPANYL